VAVVADRHRTLVAREVKRALRNACKKAEELGMSKHEFEQALLGMGEGK